MAQLLRLFTTLSEDQSSDPNIHIKKTTRKAFSSSFKGFSTLASIGTHTHTDTDKHTRIN